MLAEKCPNCGAFLPVRRAGVAVRTCEFCELEVPGEIVEVEALAGPSATWLPTPPPIRRGPPVAPRKSGGGMIVAIGVLALGAAGVGYFTLTSTTKAPPPPVATTAEAPAEVSAPLPPPEPSPAQRALTAAVAAAGGVGALDPLALLPFVDERVRLLADDAVLLSMQCFPVAGGAANLGLASGSCSYEFRSPRGAERPADVPAGVQTDRPCLLSFRVDADADEPDARVDRRPLRMCHMHHAVRPPRCTPAAVWDRAVAAGAPANAVARVRYAGRYQSGYDPIDPGDEVDHPTRGEWRVSIDGGDDKDFAFTMWDDCGDPAPTAADAAIVRAVEKARPALRRCFATAAPGERSIQALELIVRLDTDARGTPTLTHVDPGVDIEGMFSGDLGAIRVRWRDCTTAAITRWRLPPSLTGRRLSLRLEATGVLALAPPPFE